MFFDELQSEFTKYQKLKFKYYFASFVLGVVLNTLEIILCLYAIIYHIMTKYEFLNRLLQFKGAHVILILVCILLSMISIIFLLALLLPLAIYRKFVDVLLQHIHKDEYGGLLEGIDEMWALEVKESRHIINCLLFVNFTIPEEQIMKTVKEIYAEKIVYHFTSIRKKRLGYYYRLKNQASPDDLIKEMVLSEETRRDQNNFERELAKVSSSEMPMNDTASFELLVGTKPVNFSNSNGNRKSYPILMRIHHSVGDGVALLNFLLKNLVDEEISIEREFIERMMSAKKCLSYKIFSRMREYGRQIYAKIKQIKVYHFAPLSPADNNILHGPKLSGEKVLAYYVEDYPGYISRIKNLKKRIPESTFTDILMTAVSASFWEYYKQNSNNIPERIHVTFVIRPMEKNLQYTISKITGKKEIKLGNRFSMGVLGLPIRLNSAPDSSPELITRLGRVKSESEKLKNSMDILVYYWQLRFLTNLLPAPIMSYIVGLNQVSSVVLSNLPGIRAVHIRGYKVQDVIFWLPNIRNLGVGFSILTYDNRFQLGLVADKVLIPNTDKARTILENTVKYIDLLDHETQNNVKSAT